MAFEDIGKVDSLLEAAERQLEVAHKRIESGVDGGTVADASLLVAISNLLDAVKELGKRNDPLAAEKWEWSITHPEDR